MHEATAPQSRIAATASSDRVLPPTVVEPNTGEPAREWHLTGTDEGTKAALYDRA